MAVTVGVEADVAARTQGQPTVGFPSAAAPLSIGLGLGRWGVAEAENLVSRAVVPTCYLWRCATGARQPSVGLGSPDQGAVKGSVGLWANRWRSN
jgi:hypothetical protein